MARITDGNARSVSTIRMTTAAPTPRVNPDQSPSGTPTTQAATVELKATSAVLRNPNTRRLKMSRPSSSVPNRYTAPGGENRCAMLTFSGSNGTIQGESTAITTTSSTPATAI